MSIVLAFVLMFILVGCTKSNEESVVSNNKDKESVAEVSNDVNKVIRISTPIAPYSIPMFYMAEANLLGEGITLDISLHKDRQEAVARVSKNDVDILNLSVQEMAHMYNKDMNIKFLEVSNWATFKLMTIDNNINTMKDLEGKKIYTSSKGGPIDILTRTVFHEKYFDISQEIDYEYIKQGELAKMVSSELKDIKVFVLREPFASQAMNSNENIRTLYDLGELWKEIHGYRFPQSGTGVTSDFYMNEKELTKLFIEKNKEAIEWVVDNPEEAAKIGKKYLKRFDEDILVQAIKNMHMESMDGKAAKVPLEIYYNYILDFRPEMIGNKIPNDQFYEQ